MKKRNHQAQRYIGTLFFLLALIGALLGSSSVSSQQRESAPKESNGRKKKKKYKSNSPSTGLRPITNFDIKYNLNGFNQNETEKMKKALNLLVEVVESQEFKDAIENYEYKGAKTFYKNLGLNNTQIYEKILKGAEALNPIEDGTMNLKMTLYTSQTNTVGYTYPSVSEIWVNRKYFKKYSLGEVANNAIHEWLHKIGFDHSFYNNTDRPHTVPYAIGEIVEKIINEKIEGEKLATN